MCVFHILFQIQIEQESDSYKWKLHINEEQYFTKGRLTAVKKAGRINSYSVCSVVSL